MSAIAAIMISASRILRDFFIITRWFGRFGEQHPTGVSPDRMKENAIKEAGWSGLIEFVHSRLSQAKMRALSSEVH